MRTKTRTTSTSTPAHRRTLFLNEYRKCGNVYLSTKHAGVTRQTHYAWLEDPEYKRQFEEAKLDAQDWLEAECRKRATRRKAPSDTLLIFLMKKMNPEFRDNYRVDLAGAGGGPLEIQVRLVDPPEPDTTT